LPRASAADATPPLGDALAAVHTADFVGVLELLPEALCVLEYRIRRELPQHCRCSGGGAAAPRRAHVRNSKRERALRTVTVSELPAPVLRRLDAITEVDAAVYRGAVLRLLCDLRALEEATGAPVLCADRLAALRASTSHIPRLWGTNNRSHETGSLPV
jgi:hypothetical protein